MVLSLVIFTVINYHFRLHSHCFGFHLLIMVLGLTCMLFWFILQFKIDNYGFKVNEFRVLGQ